MILCLYNVDTLNICMEKFIIFVCTDSTEIFFSKLRSAGLNYNLPRFFTESYCAGVSHKHCLLTFFIILVNVSPQAPEVLSRNPVKCFQTGEQRYRQAYNCAFDRHS